MTTEEFAAAFLGRLADNAFSAHGSLSDYLRQPEAARSGDEADVVDARITRALLRALGYSDGEVTYNRSNAGQRPDYVVDRVAGYPAVCLVVEDKSTAEPNLARHRPQLAAYMAGLRCPRGLLTDGRSLLAYEATGTDSAPVLRLSIAAAVEAWRGESLLAGGKTGWEALPPADRDGLAVLLRRYGRATFAEATRLIEELTLDRHGRPHAGDGSTWVNGTAQLAIVPVEDQPDALVGQIQALIAELREDVAVQFAVHREDHAAFLRETETAPGSQARAEDVMAAIAARMLAVLPERARDRAAELETRLRAALRGERAAAEIDAVAAELRALAGGRAAGNGGGNGAGGDALAREAREARRFADRYAAHRGRAAARHEAAIATVGAYERWRAAVGTLLDTRDAARAEDEYFAQTAYIVIVRMLLVRILEDKRLTRRVFTNGGVALWFGLVEERYFSLSMGRSAARLLEIAYENAQATYAHFYDGHRVFDWYVPDRTTMIRVLHRLAGFDLRNIDRDIIGTVYGRFVNDRHKHEQGMYYTPPEVVRFILDRVGWRGREVVGRRLLDPASGSGAFLVEAARRVVEAHREVARAEGRDEIAPERVQGVLDSLRDGLVGFDLNPFACALAEINLLVQVLDLVKHAAVDHKLPIRLDRFRVYNTDALRPSAAARAALEDGLDPAEALELPDEEQAKLRLGQFAGGFDAVVANPPYVRADEGAPGQRAYREEVARHPLPAVRGVLRQKWDLFVPFVALGRALLREGGGNDGGGRMGMIVSNAVETVLYGEALRGALVRGAAVEEVHFFEPRVKLFEDAAVRNTVLVARATPAGEGPGAGHAVLREWHGAAPPAVLRRQRLPQALYGEDVFRPALSSLRVAAGREARPLGQLCYVSVGMVLNAHERLAPGAFSIDDLIATTPDDVHSRPYASSVDLRLTESDIVSSCFAPLRVRYLEYGTERVPALLRRPTFPELYDRDKLMVGEFGGVAHDDGSFDRAGHLACNHSVFLFLPWRSLAGVRNRALADRVRDLQTPREALECASDACSLGFLAGLLSSATWQALLDGNASSSIAGRAQPANYADELVPLPTPDLDAAVAAEAAAAREEGRALAGLLARGWRRLAEGWQAPPPEPAGVASAAFAVAAARWGFAVRLPDARCDQLRRDGRALLLRGQQPALVLPDTLAPEAAGHLLRVLAAQGRATLRSAEAEGLRLVLDPAEAAAAERAILAEEAAALEREREIVRRRAAIDALLAPLFEAVEHPAVEIVGPRGGLNT